MILLRPLLLLLMLPPTLPISSRTSPPALPPECFPQADFAPVVYAALVMTTVCLLPETMRRWGNTLLTQGSAAYLTTICMVLLVSLLTQLTLTPTPERGLATEMLELAAPGPERA
jgi:hypothetical protein